MATLTDTQVHKIEHAALARRAQERLAVIDDRRAALQLSEAGRSQRDIAEVLHTTQPRVHRLLKAAELVGIDESPEEMILRALVDGTDRDELVVRLSAVAYTFTEYAPYPSDGSLPGTWEQVVEAVGQGLLDVAEFDRVRDSIDHRAR